MDYEEFINQLLNTYNQGSTEGAFEMLQKLDPRDMGEYRVQAQKRLPAYTGGVDQDPTWNAGFGSGPFDMGGAGADAKVYRLLNALAGQRGGMNRGGVSDADLDLVERMLRNR